MAPRLRRISSTLGVALFVLQLIGRSESLTKPSGIKLENNEYTGIVVAIHPDEPENTEIIDVIKAMFTNASSYLYNATRKRAFFKEVTILIPETWSDDPVYTSPKNATFSGADVIIAGYNPRFAPKGENSATPYTKQFEGCGKQAFYIHMTSNFLLSYRFLQELYGDYGRILVHEWGHYRWGLFNEYPDETTDRENAKYFYYSDANRIWEPVSCTNGWRLIPLKYTGRPRSPYRLCRGDQQTGYEFGCTTQPSRDQPFVTGSIMHSYLVYPQVVNFCDNWADDQSYLHNSEAPTKHNKWCEGRSNWEVMREHSDFKDNNNPPREVDDVTPTFHVVRSRPIRVVLVLDTSGSMSTKDRYLKLADAARTYIMTVAPPGTSVGIVDFDDDHEVISYLTELTSDQVRIELSRQVPEDADGGTCIGCGMEGALNVLTAADGNADGGRIMLITDGQDGEAEHTENMKQQYIQNNVIIDSIAISDSAEPNVIDLSTSTGGRFFLQTDNINSTGTRDALASAVGDTSGRNRRTELSLDVKTFAVGETEYRKAVYIDPTLGNSTTFDFTYFSPSGGTVVDVTVTSPSGVTYNRSSTSEYWEDLTFKKITIKISNTAEPGSWEYILQNRLITASYDVIASVSSFPSQEGVDPILVDSYLSGTATDIANQKPLVAYAEVRQGFYPVIRAKVVATIETPSSTVELQLYDSGAGADITKNDGIYSRYFTQFTGVGYYGFKIRVENDGEAIVLRPSSRSRYSGVGVYFDPEALLAGDLKNFENLNISLPGTPLEELEGVPAPNFTRGVSGGATRVSETPVGWSPSMDVTAPNKITDLVIVNTSIHEESVTVSFTAPGDDLDFGNGFVYGCGGNNPQHRALTAPVLAHHYFIHWANSSYTLRNNRTFSPMINQSDIIKGDLSSPAPFGSLEVFTFHIEFSEDEDTKSVIIGVYAVDDAGNEGLMSNTEQAIFRRYIPPSIDEIDITTDISFDVTTIIETETETETKTETKTESTAKQDMENEPGNKARGKMTLLKGVIALVSVCVVFVVIFVVVKVIQARRHRTDKDKEADLALTT